MKEATAALLAVIVVVEVAELVHFSLDALYAAIGPAVAAVCSFVAGVQLQKWSRSMQTNEARLDGEGVRFQLSGDFGNDGGGGLFRWSDIIAVERRRTGNNLRIYTVRSNDGSAAVFSPLSFFRAGRVARAIASRAGCSVTKG
jgi:hypothetical protein